MRGAPTTSGMRGVVLATLCAVPAADATGQCAAAGVLYNGTGCTAGGNYNESLATTAAACCARCGAQPRCFGWTFHPANASSGRCDLSDKPKVKHHVHDATCGCRLTNCGGAEPTPAPLPPPAPTPTPSPFTPSPGGKHPHYPPKYPPGYEPKNITITKAEMTYPYSVYTDLVHDWAGDGLPEYFGAVNGGGGEACPPPVRYKCEPCPGSCDGKAMDDKPYHRKCGPSTKQPNNSSYCDHWSITVAHMKQVNDYSINKRKGVSPMTRRQILERATGWIAMGFSYKTYNERPEDWGVDALETCAKTESPNAPLSLDCPQFVTGGACCGFAAMAWQTEECARMGKISCGDLQPGDSISTASKDHIMIFRRWMDDKNSTLRKYQSGGGRGMCNIADAPRNKNSLCYRRHNIVHEDGAPENPETFDFATYPHVLAFVRAGDMHRVPLKYINAVSPPTPGDHIA